MKLDEHILILLSGLLTCSEENLRKSLAAIEAENDTFDLRRARAIGKVSLGGQNDAGEDLNLIEWLTWMRARKISKVAIAQELLSVSFTDGETEYYEMSGEHSHLYEITLAELDALVVAQPFAKEIRTKLGPSNPHGLSDNDVPRYLRTIQEVPRSHGETEIIPQSFEKLLYKGNVKKSDGDYWLTADATADQLIGLIQAQFEPEKIWHRIVAWHNADLDPSTESPVDIAGFQKLLKASKNLSYDFGIRLTCWLNEMKEELQDQAQQVNIPSDLAKIIYFNKYPIPAGEELLATRNSKPYQYLKFSKISSGEIPLVEENLEDLRKEFSEAVLAAADFCPKTNIYHGEHFRYASWLMHGHTLEFAKSQLEKSNFSDDAKQVIADHYKLFGEIRNFRWSEEKVKTLIAIHMADFDATSPAFDPVGGLRDSRLNVEHYEVGDRLMLATEKLLWKIANS